MLKKIFKQIRGKSQEKEHTPAQIYSLLFQQSKTPYAVLNPNGKLQAINNCFKQLFQLPPKTCIPFIKLLTPSHQEQFRTLLINTLDGDYYEETLNYELPHQQLLAIPTKLNPIMGNQESISHILCELRLTTTNESMPIFPPKEVIEKISSGLPILIWSFDLVQKRFEYLSPGVEKLWDIPRCLLIQDWRQIKKRIHPDDVNRVKEQYLQLLQGSSIKHSYRIVHKNGELRWINEQLYPRVNAQQQALAILGIQQDITEEQLYKNRYQTCKKSLALLQSRVNQTLSAINGNTACLLEEQKMKQFLSQQKEKIQLAEDLAQIGCWEMNLPSKQVTFSPHVAKILGIPHESKLTYDEFIHHLHPEDLAQFNTMIPKLQDDETIKLVHRIICKDHSTRYVQQIYKLLRDENGEQSKLIATMQDVTKEHQLKSKYKQLAYQDQLTRLPNRTSLVDQTTQLITTCKKNETFFSLLIININDLSRININFGYEMGDRLLQKVAFRLKRFVQSKKGMIGRLFSNRFLILQSIADLDELHPLAEEILSIFTSPFIIGNYQFYLTLNLGISAYPFDGVDYKTLLQHADTALYRSIKQGKNSYAYYTSTMDIHSFRYFSITNDLCQAFHEKKFIIHYQPRVDPHQFYLMGAVASIYWEHPEWGRLDSRELIQFIDETGQVLPIGHWFLHQVVKQLSIWQQEGYPLVPISIQYSSIQLMNSQFVNELLQLLRRYDVSPHWLELEITEQMVLEENWNILETIAPLQRAGVSFIISDFGTEHASPLLFNKVATNKLKLNQRFIQELHKNEESRLIVHSLLNLAQSMKMKSIADGVNNEEQLLILQASRCNEVTGKLFGDSMEPAAFETILQDRVCKPTLTLAQKKKYFYERRKYFRIPFTYPLEANMTIHSIGAKQVQVGTTGVLIEDIGPGGLSFLTNVKLPLSEQLVLRFNTLILGQERQFIGHTVWNQEIALEIMKYGIEFQMEEKQREQLIPFLNQLQVKLKNDCLLNNCSFIKIHNREQYFKR